MAKVKPDNFKYVFVPADDGLPIDERPFPQVELEDDHFIKMIKTSFAQANPESQVDRGMLIKQMSEHAKRDITESVDSKTLEQMLSVTSVDILSVALPSVENGHVGVSLYCDDKGKSKNLPLNHRAGGLLAACGLVGQTLHGDVFLSRMYDDGDEHWFRQDFTLGDVSSDAPWVKRARDQADRKLSSGPASLSGLAEQFMSRNGSSQRPEIISDQADGEAPSAGGNDKYRWYQTGEEIEVTIPVEESISKSRIQVDIRPKTLKVKVGDSMIIDGELAAEGADMSESTWTFSAKDRLLQITLIKKKTGSMWTDLLIQ